MHHYSRRDAINLTSIKENVKKTTPRAIHNDTELSPTLVTSYKLFKM